MHVARRAAERGRGPRDLPEEIERELQPAGRTAVLVLVAVTVCVRDPVVVEVVLERAGGVRGASQPDRAVLTGVPVREGQRGQLDGQRSAERAGRPTPGHGGAVARAHGQDQVERGAQAFFPERTEPDREWFAEQPDVRGVDVVATDAVIRVVEEPPGVLAEDCGRPHDECVQPGGIVQEADAFTTELAAGEDRGVVAGEQIGIEQLEPVRAVGRDRDLFPLGLVAVGEQGVVVERAEPSDALGDAVGEERVGRPPVDGREEPGGDCVGVLPGDRRHSGIGQVREREAQVRAYVRADGVAGEHARQLPVRHLMAFEGFEHLDREAPEPLGERGARHDAVQSAAMRVMSAAGRASSCTITRCRTRSATPSRTESGSSQRKAALRKLAHPSP